MTCGCQNPRATRVPNDIVDRQRCRVESLINMQINFALIALSEFEHFRNTRVRIRLKVRASTNDFYSKFDCIVEGCEVDATPLTAHWHVRQCNKLNIHTLPERCCGFNGGNEVTGRDRSTNVDVTSNRSDPACEQHLKRAANSSNHFFVPDHSRSFSISPPIDCPHQVALRVRHDVRGERFIKMCVRFN